MINAREMAIPGPLPVLVSHASDSINLFYEGMTYFIKNTHRQVVFSTIAPPRIGPRRLANANTELSIPVYIPTFSTVTILAMMIKTVE